MLEKFNCIVTIVNKTGDVMRLNQAVNKHGDYSPLPPSELANGDSATFELKHTNYSPYGTEGYCDYVCNGLNTRSLVRFSYSCPSGTGYNATDAVVLSGTGTGIVMIPNPLPQSGHPVNVQFTVVA